MSRASLIDRKRGDLCKSMKKKLPELLRRLQSILSSVHDFCLEMERCHVWTGDTDVKDVRGQRSPFLFLSRSLCGGYTGQTTTCYGSRHYLLWQQWALHSLPAEAVSGARYAVFCRNSVFPFPASSYIVLSSSSSSSSSFLLFLFSLLLPLVLPIKA